MNHFKCEAGINAEHFFYFRIEFFTFFKHNYPARTINFTENAMKGIANSFHQLFS